jgi:hypothetical protein
MRRHPTDIVDEAPRKHVTAFETEYKDPLPFSGTQRLSMASSSKAWVVVSSSAASIFIWRTTWVQVAGEEPAPVLGWQIESIVPGNRRVRSPFGNGRRGQLRRRRGRNWGAAACT